MLPRVNARILNSDRSNSGFGTRSSMATNAASTSTPPIRQVSTNGLVQPMTWAP